MYQSLYSRFSRAIFYLELGHIIFFQSFQNGLDGHLAVCHAEVELEQEHELAFWAARISFQAIPRTQKPAITKSVSFFSSIDGLRRPVTELF